MLITQSHHGSIRQLRASMRVQPSSDTAVCTQPGASWIRLMGCHLPILPPRAVLRLQVTCWHGQVQSGQPGWKGRHTAGQRPCGQHPTGCSGRYHPVTWLDLGNREWEAGEAVGSSGGPVLGAKGKRKNRLEACVVSPLPDASHPQSQFHSQNTVRSVPSFGLFFGCTGSLVCCTGFLFVALHGQTCTLHGQLGVTLHCGV